MQTVSATIPLAIKYRKGGRVITLGKLFLAPDGRLLFGTPYKNRPFHTPSLPPVVLTWLRAVGAVAWVIRLDERRKAYELPLSAVDQLGELRGGEWHVAFGHFVPCPYPDWPYAEDAVLFEEQGPRRNA